MTTERDIHFTTAAKLLFEKLMATRAMDTLDADRFLSDGEKAELQTLFAHFAYDLAYHVIYNEGDPDPVTDWSLENILKRIPDLTAWPTPPHP